LIHFSGFGIMCQEKSGNPGHARIRSFERIRGYVILSTSKWPTVKIRTSKLRTSLINLSYPNLT
jgi:hypothetical protein